MYNSRSAHIDLDDLYDTQARGIYYQHVVGLVAAILLVVDYLFVPWVNVPFVSISASQMTSLGPVAGLGNLVFVPVAGVLSALISGVSLWRSLNHAATGIAQVVVCVLGLIPVISVWSALGPVLEGVGQWLHLPIDLVSLGLGFHAAWVLLLVGVLVGIYDLVIGVRSRV